MARPLPLKGFRILDFTQFFSGPVCTMMLSDFGAEVIKLENPPKGDATRYGNVLRDGHSTHYATRNRGKKSVLLNMKDEAQKNMFLELVKTADAVVENFKPGTMEKFGITYELLEQINPRIVYTSISGFGQSGPYAGRAAFDMAVQAESGLMSITGEQGGHPVLCGGAVSDYCGGLLGCIGTLVGIIDAQRTGHGRRIDSSMMDSLILLQENRFSSYLENGIIPQPNGNRNPAASPINDFMCKDGVPVLIVVSTDKQWQVFAKAFQHPEWLENPEWKTMSQRAKHVPEIEAEVSKVFMEYTSKEVEDIMEANKLVYGLINNYEAVVNHPQVKYRKTFVNAVFDDGTTFSVPGNPVVMSDVDKDIDYHTADLGQDTIAVLSEVADEKTVHEIMDPVLEKAKA